MYTDACTTVGCGGTKPKRAKVLPKMVTGRCEAVGAAAPHPHNGPAVSRSALSSPHPPIHDIYLGCGYTRTLLSFPFTTNNL